jgi:hypothetical protein
MLLSALGAVFAQLPDSLNMRLVGTWTAPAGVELGSVIAKNGLAYVTSGIDTLYILDISNPASPTIYEKLYDGDWWSGQVLSDSFLFVGGGNFRAIDIYANPPEIVGNIDFMIGRRLCYSKSAKTVFSNGTPIEVMDVSNPASPLHDTTYSMAGYVAVRDSFMYVSNWSCAPEVSGYRVFNISNPDAPILRSTNCFPLTGDVSYSIEAMTADEYGAYMFVPAEYQTDFFHLTACDRNDTLIGYTSVSSITAYNGYVIVRGIAQGSDRLSVWKTFSGCSLKVAGHHVSAGRYAVGACLNDSLYVVLCTSNQVRIFKVDSVRLQVCELEEKYRHDDLHIYPNPLGIGGKAFVRGGSAKIFDINGRKMGDISPDKPLNTSNFPPGVYLAVSENRKSITKFVVIN